MNTLGNMEQARRAFHALYEASSAYRDLLSKHGLTQASDWKSLPILDKSQFYAKYPWSELMGNSPAKTLGGIVRSSGTTRNDAKRGFFWPLTRDDQRAAHERSEKILTRLFSLDSRTTLGIVALSLGSWAGGENMSALFRSLALTYDRPFTVFSAGEHLDEVVELVRLHGDEFDQILLALAPSAVSHLEEACQKVSFHWPWDRVTLLCTGESFPEAFRDRILLKCSSQHVNGLPLVSIYASADTGVLGIESPRSIQRRREEAQKSSYSPNIFEPNSSEVFYETHNGRLLVTRLQALPLVRYDLGDRADIREGLLWIYGRDEGSVSLFESKVFSWMLESVVARSTWFQQNSTGRFLVWPDYDRERAVLNWEIELLPHVSTQVAAEERLFLQDELIYLLAEEQTEFAQDKERFYDPLRKEDQLDLFHFHFTAAPFLSQAIEREGRIKPRIIRHQRRLFT